MFGRLRVQISIEEFPPPKFFWGRGTGDRLWDAVSRPPVLIFAAIQQSLTALPLDV